MRESLCKRRTHHKMLKRICEDLRPPRRDCRTVVFSGPKSRVNLEAAVHRGRDARFDKQFSKHRKPILDDRSAKKEGIHQSGREYRGIARVTKAKYPL